ncbi:MAG: cell wall hydrolase [Woeseiaceae bacterium]
MRKLTTGVMLILTVGAAGCADTRVATPPQSSTLERRDIEPGIRHQQECMALAMYWEARGEGRRGMEAVGWTIRNRVHSPHFPSTPCEVVYEGGERPGCQFSWYCDGKSDRPRDRDSWQHAMLIAGDLLTRPGADPTGGALFFHASGIRTPWHRNRPRAAQIGGHVFYR